MRTILAAISPMLVLLVACTDPATAPAPEPRPLRAESPRDPAAIQRGRQIFLTGKSPSGDAIEAQLVGDVVTDASTLPCVGCHGEDGRGRPEGGMTPSNITWEQLSKPYGGRGEDGRQHAAYDSRSVRKAITMGIDPSGNQLLATMPRHRMSQADLDSLVAYLETLGNHQVIGIDDQTITLATVLPIEAPDLVETVLLAYFAEVNARGGVFGRKLELEVLRLRSDASIDEQVDRLATWWAEQPIFAVIAPQLGAAESELLRWFAAAGVPVIGPATHYPDPGTPPLRSVFWVDGGVPAQAIALAEFAASDEPASGDSSRRGVVVFPDREPEQALARAVLEVWRPLGIDASSASVVSGESADDLADRLIALEPDFVVFLGPAELGLPTLTSLADAQRSADPPRILLPGTLAIGDPFTLPDRLSGNVFVAYPWLPDDLAPAALRDYQALVEAHHLPTSGRPVQLASLAAAKILLEGLTRAGRAVTRDSLITNIESLREFATGLTPALSYGPNQHIGLHDPRIVAIDLHQARLTPIE